MNVSVKITEASQHSAYRVILRTPNTPNQGWTQIPPLAPGGTFLVPVNVPPPGGEVGVRWDDSPVIEFKTFDGTGGDVTVDFERV